MESKIKTFLAALFVFFLVNTGIAAAFSVDLTTPNNPIFPVMTYATVQGSVDGADNTLFHFKVDLAAGLKNALNGGKNFGMDKFYFNTDLNLSDSMFINSYPTAWDISYIKNVAGFGTFDVKLADPGNRTEYLYFDIDFTSALAEENFLILSEGNAGNGNGQFTAHIGGFDLNDNEQCAPRIDGIDKDDQSVWVRDDEDTPPIPEPGTMILLGISLITAAGYMRRLSKNDK